MADYSATNQTITVTNVNVNAVGDTPFFVPFARFCVENVRVTNASTNLGATSATLGVYTAPAAGGTAIVTAATGVLTPLTTADIVNSATVAGTGAITPTVVNNNQRQLYLRCGVANGAAATVTVIIKILRIP